MQQVQRAKTQLLYAPRLKFRNRVCPNVAPTLVLAPVVALGEVTDGQAFLGDVLPELALGFDREDDALLCNRVD